jgi:hypothetical protein
MSKKNDVAVAPFLDLSDDVAKFPGRMPPQIVNRFRSEAP